MAAETREHARLAEIREREVPWRKWGPYLSERQWGTVREDRSQTGDAWNNCSHDQARSRAYRWGEDGIAGISDDGLRLCFALALWNGVDPILKERLFGLTNGEGNHGEDVKECYYYLDNTPTHSYMRMLYKYPQRAFPYDDLVRTNRERSRLDPEYELIDTGVFDDDAYFDVVVEYAKSTPEELLIRITVTNRGSEDAVLHLLPHLWFRNTWWLDGRRPSLEARRLGRRAAIEAVHPDLGTYLLACDRDAPLLFTENETNERRVFGHETNPSPFVKDGINDRVVHDRKEAVNAERGTKAAAWFTLTVPAGGLQTVRLCLGAAEEDAVDPFADFDEMVRERAEEADEFYDVVLPETARWEAADVARQGFAGLLWSKQAYVYDVAAWIASGSASRNQGWTHLAGADVISVPDKWEYPWFAAWDLAFHSIALAFVDPDFAFDQLELLLGERYMHPNGQIPAYEWNFGDVNPPVHAWATLSSIASRGDIRTGWIDRMRKLFHKLLLNFTWWVNRKDRHGRNVFEGGFLGLDNIGVFDRSAAAHRRHLDQADGTAWMALYRQTMLELAIELARHDPVYEDFAIKFYEHFIWIASAMDRVGGGDGMWDEEDGFFYDVLRLPDGTGMRSKSDRWSACCRSVPSPCTRTTSSTGCRGSWTTCTPSTGTRRRRACDQPARAHRCRGAFMLSILDESKLRRVLARLLDRRSSSAISAFVRCLVVWRTRHTSSFAGASASRSPTGRRNPTRGCSAAIPTGAARSGCRSTR
jgi:hypothetical protein